LTFRSQATAAELFARSQMGAVIDGLPDATVVIDLELKLIAWNSAYTQMTGLRPRRMQEAALHSKCHELVHLGICKEKCLARHAADTKQRLRVDEIDGTAVKAPHPVRLTLVVQAIPLRDDNGDIYAVIEIYRDVTAEARIQSRYKSLLDAEKRHVEELEHTVSVRTQELSGSLAELRATQAQLIQAEKLSSLGRLVSGIAHELNNPLNFIYANLDFLDSHVEALTTYIAKLEGARGTPLATSAPDRVDIDYLKEDLVKVASTIREGAERAIKIVKGLRTFSHSGASAGGAVALAPCVAAVEHLLHHELRRANVVVVSEIPADCPSVFANQPQVEQVLINLLTNAAHAMADAGGRITIGSRIEADEVVLIVSDEGGGIPSESLGKIFDPFFTTKAVGQGTGLGLSISRSIMLSWNGSIAAENIADGGARFTLRFKQAQPG
jgi:two-component system NtrC family sensor kinase